MRIISGYLKGKKLALPKDKNTRPLRDMVKESIFNVIEHSQLINCKIKNSKVLDLFSGTGSFGLECISRGAKKVVFCENHLNAQKILENNISNLNCHNTTQVIGADIFVSLESGKFQEDAFEIIFLDPPYKEEKIHTLLLSIKKNKILKKNGLIILHRHKKEKDLLPDEVKILNERTYGLSKIIFAS
tara:strand:+ start:29 stop:589 length:561 start_codon:yes stop_codon:yes gene_type:complete